VPSTWTAAPDEHALVGDQPNNVLQIYTLGNSDHRPHPADCKLDNVCQA
jgi:hypothetical protein